MANTVALNLNQAHSPLYIIKPFHLATNALMYWHIYTSYHETIANTHATFILISYVMYIASRGGRKSSVKQTSKCKTILQSFIMLIITRIYE